MPTAAVMGVVVISIGVIVGFVSYRDAFVPKVQAQIPVHVSVSTPVTQKLPTQMTVTAPIAQKNPGSPIAPKLVPKPAAVTTQRPFPTLPTQATPSKIEEKPAPVTRPVEEALPRLPKIQRLPESSGATFPSQAKPTSPAPQTASSTADSESAQAKNLKPRKTRVRKTLEVPNLDDEKNE